MAFKKTYTLTAVNGDVYADTAAWVAAHGPCGTENNNFVTEGVMTLLDGSNSVKVVLTYDDEVSSDAHDEAFKDEVKDDVSWSDLTTETI